MFRVGKGLGSLVLGDCNKRESLLGFFKMYELWTMPPSVHA